MKNNALIFLLFATIACFSQTKNISIESFRTTDKIIHGIIHEKYNVTIYLKVAQFSEDHQFVFSVKGWYYYDNVKNNIPLVGVYSPQNGLVLYNLSDKKLESRIINLDFPGIGIWEKLDKINQILDFNEKFNFSDIESENFWISGTKKYKFSINNPENAFIITDYNILKINSTNLNLNNYIQYHQNLEIVSKNINSKETKILLKYEELGNPNIQGMCGAAEDFGYIFLYLNEQNDVVYFNEIEIDNCRGMISSEEIETGNKNILKYRVTNSQKEKENVKIITIDLNSVSLK